MRYLLIDISNSRTKLACGTAEAVGESRWISTRDLTPMSVEAAAAGWAFDRAVLSSVVPGKNAAVRDAVPCPLLVLDHTCELGVAIDYPRPETIGADRLANAAAAAALYGCPSVVIDFGTAVTFDVLSAAGAYTGGVIAPGLEAMTHYLHERTALLPEIDLTEPTSPVGRSTRDAMLAGAVIGYRGLVKEILSAVMEEIGSPDAPAEVIATGGYAELIGAKVPAIAHVHPTLTLEGLRIAANLNPIP